MKMDRFFVVVARINSVLFLLVLLGAAAGLALAIWQAQRWNGRGAVEVTKEGAAKKRVVLRFGQPERITGTNAQMLKLNSDAGSAEYSSGKGSDTRNILFLTDAEKQGRWLFKDHRGLVLDTAQVREETLPDQKAFPARAVYVEYVAIDTNGDGELSHGDSVTVGFAKPDGTGFVAVLQGIKNVLSHDVAGAGDVSVVYQKDKALRRAKFSVADFQLVSDEEIASLPEVL